MADIIVKNGQELGKVLLTHLAGLSDQKVMTRLGSKVKRHIEDRTVKENKGVDGSALPGYSTKPIYVSKKENPRPRGGIDTPQTIKRQFAYAAKIGKSQKPTKGTGGKTMFFPGGYAEYKSNIYGPGRNLTKTGRMFEALTYKAEDKTVTLYFNEVDNANAKAWGNQERTPFFGIGGAPGEEEWFTKTWEDAVNGK